MDGKKDHISFMIKRIKVHTDEAMKSKDYRFPGNYGVEKFLEIFSGRIEITSQFLFVLRNYKIKKSIEKNTGGAFRKGY